MSKKVVVASGYFNPLHWGHVSFLQKAREQGDSLVVIVNNDVQQALAKAGRPEFARIRMPARDRVRLVRALGCVDCAVEAIDDDESVCETLRLLHPDIFANGGSKSATESEMKVCQELGIQIVEGLGTEMLMLKPFTQHYDWGKPRDSSAVARLAGQDKHESPSDAKKKKPFAELWMGDHPSGPSGVTSPMGTNVGSLPEMLKRQSSVLGPKLAEAAQLPFLLKVLSIHKALSIQAHPDRALATKLHAERPDVYKDPNHKPEIAIALTDFEALCGFRPVAELSKLVEAVPELRQMVGEEAAVALRASLGCHEREARALKAAYCRVMRTPEAEAQDLAKRMCERVVGLSEDAERPQELKTAHELVLRLDTQFGPDVGVFSVFFLNYVRMSVGECLYMPQNTPHAYLSGDIVECMACSDNVVRGGLTPKYKDIEVLCEMLEYRGGEPPVVKAMEVDEGVLLYQDADIEEFQVTHVELPAGRQRRCCFSGQGPALAFAWKGAGSVTISGETTVLRPGVVFLLGAGVDADLSAEEDLHVFVACCPPHYFKAIPPFPGSK